MTETDNGTTEARDPQHDPYHQQDRNRDRNHDLNEIRISGRLSADADIKDLASGDVLVLLKVVVGRAAGNRVDSLPVVVGPGPEKGRRRDATQPARRTVARATKLSEGDRVLVEGWLKRHFWDAGGVRRSRLQVVATEITRH